MLNFTNWVCSDMWFDSLTEEQQNLLIETGKEAGVYNNELQAAADEYYMNLMIEEGVTVYQPTEEDIKAFQEKAEAFYADESVFGWTEGLYDTVVANLKLIRTEGAEKAYASVL